MNDNKLVHPISVYLDNNVWDFLFKQKLDLWVELPRDEFCVCITREAEFEIPAIPPEKADLKAFVEETIEKCSVRTDAFFGFHNPAHSPTEQRNAGFDRGRYARPEEVAFMRQQNTPLRERKMMKTRLLKDEADISLAARALHSVVLTFDKKPGPINDAYKQGGKVVYLTDFDNQPWQLKYFIKSELGMLRLPEQ